MTFGYRLTQPIAGVAWPTLLQQLLFGHYFNQPITGAVWPTSLRQATFGDNFNHPIVGVGWPASLRKLFFGWSMNQPLFERYCSGINSFNQPIDGVRWPAALQRLSFGGGFRQQRPLAGLPYKNFSGWEKLVSRVAPCSSFALSPSCARWSSWARPAFHLQAGRFAVERVGWKARFVFSPF